MLCAKRKDSGQTARMCSLISLSSLHMLQGTVSCEANQDLKFVKQTMKIM